MSRRLIRVLLFCLGVFLVPGLALVWRMVEGPTAFVDFAALGATILVGSLVASMGYALGIFLPPAADLSHGASYLTGAVIGALFAVFAAMSSIHVGILGLAYFVLTSLGTWIGKKLLGSPLGEELPPGREFDLRKVRKTLSKGNLR